MYKVIPIDFFQCEGGLGCKRAAKFKVANTAERPQRMIGMYCREHANVEAKRLNNSVGTDADTNRRTSATRGSSTRC